VSSSKAEPGQSPRVAARLVFTRSGVVRLGQTVSSPSDCGQLRVPPVEERDPWAFQTSAGASTKPVAVGSPLANARSTRSPGVVCCSTR